MDINLEQLGLTLRDEIVDYVVSHPQKKTDSIQKFFQYLCDLFGKKLDAQTLIIDKKLRIIAKKGFSSAPITLGNSNFKPLHPETCITRATPLIKRQFMQKQPLKMGGPFQQIFDMSFPLIKGEGLIQFVIVLKFEGDIQVEQSFIQQVLKHISSHITTYEFALNELLIKNEYIDSLAKVIKTKSVTIYEHCQNVSEYCRIIGQLMHLNPLDLERLIDAAKVHDIGLLHVPNSILNKPGNLSHSEYALVCKGIEESYQILSSQVFYDIETIAKIIYAHMEQMDGTGYPRGMKASQISLPSKILSVANAYDAMTSVRSYQKALSHHAALHELLRGSNQDFNPELTRSSVKTQQFDAKVVNVFVDYLRN
ncbi:MAG: HD domain-containing protein [Candidatus Cloacimonetes bacterium]|nr:HD domain-containing protein [Candidatus Cloacimonadota bacterium]